MRPLGSHETLKQNERELNALMGKNGLRQRPTGERKGGTRKSRSNTKKLKKAKKSRSYRH